MRKLILLSLTLLMLPFMFSSNLYAIDSIGYRYYHDMDNEREGSKYRAYLAKKFYKHKFKFAYERKKNWKRHEAGTWFIDHSIKF